MKYRHISAHSQRFVVLVINHYASELLTVGNELIYKVTHFYWINIVFALQVYQLTHNYRSHAGILSLSSSVLDLLVEFFPESFDKLNPDQGLFHGPQPILLESCSFSDLAVLLRGNKRKTSHIEFGAHQAILGKL